MIKSVEDELYENAVRKLFAEDDNEATSIEITFNSFLLTEYFKAIMPNPISLIGSADDIVNAEPPLEDMGVIHPISRRTMSELSNVIKVCLYICSP